MIFKKLHADIISLLEVQLLEYSDFFFFLEFPTWLSECTLYVFDVCPQWHNLWRDFLCYRFEKTKNSMSQTPSCWFCELVFLPKRSNSLRTGTCQSCSFSLARWAVQLRAMAAAAQTRPRLDTGSVSVAWQWQQPRLSDLWYMTV